MKEVHIKDSFNKNIACLQHPQQHQIQRTLQHPPQRQIQRTIQHPQQHQIQRTIYSIRRSTKYNALFIASAAAPNTTYYLNPGHYVATKLCSQNIFTSVCIILILSCLNLSLFRQHQDYSKKLSPSYDRTSKS